MSSDIGIQESIDNNRLLWNSRVPVHLESDWYGIHKRDPDHLFLDDIERTLLGDICDKSVLHLQCHFGLSTISLARLGAKVVGLDFSDEAIIAARKLANEQNVTCEFVCADATCFSLNKTFDIIFTSWGVLTWLPDLEGWARSIAEHLSEHGRVIVIDSHPIHWVFCDAGSNHKALIPHYPYFQDKTAPTVVEDGGSYVDDSIRFGISQSNWNHSIGAVVTNLARAGIVIDDLTEYPRVPWRPFNDMYPCEQPGFWGLSNDPIPLSFSIEGRKYDTSK